MQFAEQEAPDVAVVRAATFGAAVQDTYDALSVHPRALRLEHEPTGDDLLDAAHSAAIHGFGRSLRIELRDTTSIHLSPPRFLVPHASSTPHPPRTGTPRCVITGAGAGIGRALTHEFGQAGYVVMGVDVDARAAGHTETELRGQGVPARITVQDLRGLDCLPCSAETPVDVVVHNAAISEVGPFSQAPIERCLQVVDVNLDCPIRLTQRLLTDGALAEGGSIVFVSSLSHFMGYPGAAVYAGTKDGLAAYAEALRSAYSEDVLRVLTVFPGPVRTAHARRYSPDNSAEHRRMSPEAIARQTRVAIEQGRSHLVPGRVNQLMASIGRRFPTVADGLMDRAVFRRLQTAHR
jgi:short-subunit dehydrogenase